jgi:hypothetical protein
MNLKREREREKREIAILVGFALGGGRRQDLSQFEKNLYYIFKKKGTRPMLYFSEKTKEDRRQKKKEPQD